MASPGMDEHQREAIIENWVFLTESVGLHPDRAAIRLDVKRDTVEKWLQQRRKVPR